MRHLQQLDDPFSRHGGSDSLLTGREDTVQLVPVMTWFLCAVLFAIFLNKKYSCEVGVVSVLWSDVACSKINMEMVRKTLYLLSEAFCSV